MNLRCILTVACLLTWASHDRAAAAPEDSPNESLVPCMERAWGVSWQRFYLQAAYWEARRRGL